MNENSKKKIFNSFFDIIAVFSILISLICFNLKLKGSNLKFEKLNIFAAKTIFFRGNTENFFKNIFGKFSNTNDDFEKSAAKPVFGEKNKYSIFSPIKSGDFKLPKVLSNQEDDGPKAPGEATCKIIESQIGASGTKFENFYFKNAANVNVNIAEELSKKPEVKISKTNLPQVLVVHTHATESYMTKDQGFFYENYNGRSDNDEKNVTKVGEALVQSLEKHGFKTIHDKSHNDCPTFNGSYERAGKVIKSNLEKYPSIQIVLDIHRDSLGAKESGKIKPTFKFGGDKAAQIMVIAGCDTNNSIGHPNWEKNLRLALRVQQAAETLFPGITRPLKFDNVKYNMHITPGSLLIEIGSDVNTLAEAVATGAMVGESVAKVLESLI